MDIEAIQQASRFIQNKHADQPTIGLILGSGLGVLADEITDSVSIPYEEIPGFPVSTVAGHKGQLVIGKLEEKTVVAMQGRFHYYEGYSLEKVTFPVRVMRALGIKSLVVTNAAGGINQSYKPGDLMIMTDHINNTGSNPLIGENNESLGVRFPDLSRSYDEEYIKLTEKTASNLNINIRKGVYVGNTGPTYETPAEIKMLRDWGGDAVGMSTVPEVIVARHESLRVLGISCISNMAAGILDHPLTHEEVIETTSAARDNFLKLVKKIIFIMPEK